MVGENSHSDGEESEFDAMNKGSKFPMEDVEWRDRDESTWKDDGDEADMGRAGFHPPCEHCGSTTFKQEVTTTNYVECDAKGNFVDQETEHERDEIIYCNECGQKLSERTMY